MCRHIIIEGQTVIEGIVNMLYQRSNTKAAGWRSLPAVSVLAALAILPATVWPHMASAQNAPAAPQAQAGDEAGKKPAVQNWQASVNVSADANQNTLDPKTQAIIDRIDAYFNKMNMFKGRFIQTNPDDKTMKGRFYVKRPGMMRFDYSPPSKLRIVSNGRYLSIEDHDMKTVDRYPLDATPFGILLAKEVNLARDARIIQITEGDDYITLTIEDKSGKTAGQIKLFFAKGDELTLKEWIITDPQGLNTKIEVANLEIDDGLKSDFFALSNIDLQKALE